VVTIELLGELAKFGDIPPLDVRSAAEAIRFISDQIPEFRQFLAETAANAYQVIVDGAPIDEGAIEYPALISVVIQPVIAGAGDLGKILLGAVLLGVSFLMPASFLGISSTLVGQFGAALVLGGLAGLINPQTTKEQKNESSFLLDAGGVARSSQGQPVPVLVGQRIIQPVPIAVWIDNENIAIDYAPA
jgi:predicted phage tail protein